VRAAGPPEVVDGAGTVQAGGRLRGGRRRGDWPVPRGRRAGRGRADAQAHLTARRRTGRVGTRTPGSSPGSLGVDREEVEPSSSCCAREPRPVRRVVCSRDGTRSSRLRRPVARQHQRGPLLATAGAGDVLAGLSGALVAAGSTRSTPLGRCVAPRRCRARAGDGGPSPRGRRPWHCPWSPASCSSLRCEDGGGHERTTTTLPGRRSSWTSRRCATTSPGSAAARRPGLMAVVKATATARDLPVRPGRPRGGCVVARGAVSRRRSAPRRR